VNAYRNGYGPTGEIAGELFTRAEQLNNTSQAAAKASKLRNVRNEGLLWIDTTIYFSRAQDPENSKPNEMR